MELLSASIQGKVLVSPWRQTRRQHRARIPVQPQTQTQTQTQTQQTQTHTQLPMQTQTKQRRQHQNDPLVHSLSQGPASKTSKEDLSHAVVKQESIDLPHEFGGHEGRLEIESIEHNLQSKAFSNSPIVSKHSSPSASWHHQQSDDFLDSTPIQEPPILSQSFLIATPTSSGAIVASMSATGSTASAPLSSTPIDHETTNSRCQGSLKSRDRPFQRSSSTPNLSSSSLTAEPIKKRNSKRKRRRSQSVASSPSISSSMLVAENLSDITRYLENDLSGTRPSF